MRGVSVLPSRRNTTSDATALRGPADRRTLRPQPAGRYTDGLIHTANVARQSAVRHGARACR